MKIILPIILLLSACSEQHPASYEVLPNPLEARGPTINYDPQSSLTNVKKIASELSKTDADIFNQSLAWYGTESDYGLERIHNKTARELVDIVNCLKVSQPAESSDCFN